MAEETSNKTSNRSDVAAKMVFKDLLINKDFIIQNWNVKKDGKCPADIYAKYKYSEDYYFFEIKKTKIKENKQNVFGAASLNEWKAAMDNKERFFFVLAVEMDNGTFDFYLIKPETFMVYSTIPSFKVYFNIPVEKTTNGLQFIRPGRKEETIIMDSIIYEKIKGYWGDLSIAMTFEGQTRQVAPNDFRIIKQDKDLFEQLNNYRGKNILKTI